MQKLEELVFYQLENAIKAYRQFAQKQITKAGFDITIDQWLVIKTIQENENLAQQHIAEKVFKDVASVTRIIELLVKKGYITRSFHQDDRRRFALAITPEGEAIVSKVLPIIEQNRAQALASFSQNDIKKLQSLLTTFTQNCL
ncbi:MAG: MarR family transcriptional regulator [Candidatus Kapabacteria bacterium]|jgi:DNA-binding MarR family transcriptional regulator|nr:MarR family transcriptional regulator [Candidatus Kapabacteria bacterium]